MAIPKKKMAGKPVKAKSLRKAQDGTEVKFNTKTGEQTNKDLSEVTKKETNMEALKGFYKKDYLKADSAKTKTGKVLRKVGNTAIKAAFTPQALMATALRTGSTAKSNKEELSKKKMGGKVKKKK